LLTFPSADSTNEIRDHTVKDPHFLQYKAKPDLVIKSDQDRLDPELGRTPAVHEGQSAFRGTQNIADRPCQSIEIHKSFANFSDQPSPEFQRSVSGGGPRLGRIQYLRLDNFNNVRD
jgi:hypothetical protein